jgi:hypothetical protein
MFQKMSEEEMERRARDAEEVRRDMVQGTSATTSENPFQRTLDSDFRERYGGALYQEENNNSVTPGIVNVQIKHGDRRSPLHRVQRKLPFLQKAERALTDSIGDVYENQEDFDNIKSNRKRQILSEYKQLRKTGELTDAPVTDAVTGFVAKNVGRFFIGSAYLWTNFIYLFLQLWMGIIAVMAIGVVLFIEAYVGSGVTKTVFDATMSTLGVDWDFYLVATLMYMLVVAVCYFQLFGVVIQANALKLRPLGGKGSLFKTGTFLFCLIFYWVPLVNCLPLVNLYILSIQVAPR